MPPKDALSELYAIMNDHGAKERDRINSARSASRVEPLTQPGQPAPPGVTWLRKMIDDPTAPTGYKAECAAALAYWERRAKKNALQFNVTNTDEQREAWRRTLNAVLRNYLWTHNLWPQHKGVLIAENDEFIIPPHDPELGVAALFFSSSQQQFRKPRQRAIDQPPPVFIANEKERREILSAIAHATAQRLQQCNDTRARQVTRSEVPMEGRD